MKALTSYESLVALLESIRSDVERAEVKGNKAAGTRVRKAMQEVKKMAQQVRQDILGMRPSA